MLCGGADDFLPVLRSKQMLSENRQRGKEVFVDTQQSSKTYTQIQTQSKKAHQSAEASIQDAESSLVIGDLYKTLHVTIVVGTHHPVSLGVNLVDAARRHL